MKLGVFIRHFFLASSQGCVPKYVPSVTPAGLERLRLPEKPNWSDPRVILRAASRNESIVHDLSSTSTGGYFTPAWSKRSLL